MSMLAQSSNVPFLSSLPLMQKEDTLTLEKEDIIALG